MTPGPLNVAVFASGSGSNFQALLDHQSERDEWRVVVLVCNREAGAMRRARAAGVDAVLVPTKDREASDVARDTLEVLEAHHVDVVLLAGYLRLLPSEVVRRYAGRILNIHPALLPDFGGRGMYGMNVHRAVVASGASESGASVHLVDEEYDRGAIVGQWRVPVLPGDTPEELAARVLAVEHRLYPRAVDHLCSAVRAGRRVEAMPDPSLEHTPEPSEGER